MSSSQTVPNAPPGTPSPNEPPVQTITHSQSAPTKSALPQATSATQHEETPSTNLPVPHSTQPLSASSPQLTSTPQPASDAEHALEQHSTAQSGSPSAGPQPTLNVQSAPVAAIHTMPPLSHGDLPAVQAPAITPNSEHKDTFGVAPSLGVSPSDVPARIRSPSLSSVQRPVDRYDQAADLASRSRADKPEGLVIPARPGMTKAASSGDLKSGLASPIIPTGAVEILIASVHTEQSSSPFPLALVEIYAGASHKAFEVHRHHLTSKSVYFKSLFRDNPAPSSEQLTFEDLDEYAMALFVRWLYGGELHGPNDFHSFQRYLSLYVLAQRFHIEALSNNVMDLTRAYYRQHSMTAPSYRIEYIYTYTSTPNHMRNFLVTTAAYRCLCEAPLEPNIYLSDALRELLAKGGDVAVDFSESLIKLSKNGIVDVRRGSNCVFHDHEDCSICREAPLEPYQQD